MSNWVDLGPGFAPKPLSEVRDDLRELERLRQQRFRDESELRDLRTQISRLESQTNRGPAPRAKQRNRVIYWVTVYLESDTAAERMGSLLWQERRKNGDDPEPGLKVATWSADGRVLKLVIDYTVKGGNPQDLWREDGSGRPGMLNRVADRLGVTIYEVYCDEQSREILELR